MRCATLSLLLGLCLATPAMAEPAIVRVQLVFEPTSLDPHKFDGVEEYRIGTDLFEGLTTMSATDAVIPGAAESWDKSADGLTWTFHLRSDVLWSDGTPVTAEDFVYSFRRALDPATASPYVIALLPIVNASEISAGTEKDLSKLGVSAPDPRTVVVTLAKPTPWLLELMTSQTAMPVPRHVIEQWGDKWTLPAHIVSNGPFMLKEWVPLSRIAMVRNPKFHDSAAVKLDEVDYMLADDYKAALKRYEAGELDITQVNGQDMPRLRQERPSELRSTPLLATSYITFNMNGPLGADKRVRQALAMVIDRDVLENQVIRRGQTPAYSFVPPDMPGYAEIKPDWSTKPMAERIAIAKQLLAESGVSQPLTIHLLSFKQDLSLLYDRAVIEMWHAALGVETEEEALEARVVDGRITHHDFEVTFTSWYADYADPWTFLANLRSDAAGLNYGNYANPAYDALLEQSRAAADPDTRMKLLEQAEALMLADQPIIPIHNNVGQNLVNPRIRGWESAPLSIHPDRFLSLDQGPAGLSQPSR